MKYADITLGQIEAIINKLGGEQGALRFLRGELQVSESTRLWREEDGIIYFSVTSDGTTGDEWITRLESKGFRIGKGSFTEQILRSPLNFKPTSGVTTEVAILKSILFEENNRGTDDIRAEADKHKFSKPNTEVACLIREKFTDDEIRAMGLQYLIVMHEPINDRFGISYLLTAWLGDNGRWLSSFHCRNGIKWCCNSGFAFAVSRSK